MGPAKARRRAVRLGWPAAQRVERVGEGGPFSALAAESAAAAGITPILIVRPEDLSQPRILDYSRREEQASNRCVATASPSAMTISSLREVLAAIDGDGS